ncbi:unnamed protein product [Psylliodes chrysocephalus]|uniref:Uncharacterized protein n=1 Tax=Psylliodes chrysocephalus TaxID=3402493 RepID=A0A9P0DE07_9CUCU|nr:unnamed protein product [Psylliodes chrysocephala]
MTLQTNSEINLTQQLLEKVLSDGDFVETSNLFSKETFSDHTFQSPDYGTDNFFSEDHDNLLTQLEKNKMPDFIFKEGLKFIAGYVAYRFKNEYSNLKLSAPKTFCQTTHTPDWIEFISGGNLIYPSEEIKTSRSVMFAISGSGEMGKKRQPNFRRKYNDTESEGVARNSPNVKSDGEKPGVEDFEEDINLFEESEEDDENLPLINKNFSKDLKSVEYEEVKWEDLQEDTFILAKFSGIGKRSNNKYKYVCVVQKKDEDDGEIAIIGLKSLDETCSDFYINEMIVSYITIDNVTAILPKPVTKFVGRKMIYSFPGKVDIFEKS